MKAILEYYLPEDEEEYNNARNGAACHSILTDLAGNLRDRLKYDPPKNKKEYDALNGVYVRLFKLAEEYGIIIW